MSPNAAAKSSELICLDQKYVEAKSFFHSKPSTHSLILLAKWVKSSLAVPYILKKHKVNFEVTTKLYRSHLHRIRLIKDKIVGKSVAFVKKSSRNVKSSGCTAYEQQQTSVLYPDLTRTGKTFCGRIS
eukprot:PhF_6_TR33284/c0_g1_i1/m.48761